MTEFTSKTYNGQIEFEVIIRTDSEEHYKAAEGFARKLIDHAKPQTNGDRIRAMSDELPTNLMEIPINADFGAILNCAVRYALGRQTYMPGLVIDFIRPLLPFLSNDTLWVFDKDIEEATRISLGEPFIDAPKWKTFHQAVKTERRKRHGVQIVDEIKHCKCATSIHHIARCSRYPEMVSRKNTCIPSNVPSVRK
jgi:hypothetical protein